MRGKYLNTGNEKQKRKRKEKFKGMHSVISHQMQDSAASVLNLHCSHGGYWASVDKAYPSYIYQFLLKYL